MRIFTDCDGVLSSFNQHMVDLFGVRPSDVSEDEMWRLVGTVPDFWLTMPLKFRAHDLWRFIQPYSPVILTGCPKSLFDIAARQKVAWAKKHFGANVQVITCLSRDKPLHLESPDDILIDDFKSKVRRWQQAGGRGVHYRTFEQTITDLKALLDAPAESPTD